MIARRVVIAGRVQGVGFRAWTADEASARSLTGWVRNLRDGRVEALLCGAEPAVEDMIARCRKGPRLAEVREVSVFPAAIEAWDGFEARPTA